MTRKLVMKERDRVRREMDYLEIILQTLIDDVNEFTSGKSRLDKFCEQLKENIDGLARRWSELSQANTTQEEADFIREMGMSTPKPDSGGFHGFNDSNGG